MKLPFHARRAEIANIIGPFVATDAFKRLKTHRQHLFFNRYEHLVHTASIAHRLAKLARADVRVCVLAGLLHDFHETRIKGHAHGVESAENARSIGMDDDRVLAIVRAHMFPFGWGKVPTPWNREFAVVKIADASAAVMEAAYGFLDTVFAWNFKPAFRLRSTRSILEYVELELLARPCFSSSTNP